MDDLKSSSQQKPKPEPILVPVPFTDRNIQIPQPIMIPLVPVWKGLHWFAQRVDGAARRVVYEIKNLPGWRR